MVKYTKKSNLPRCNFKVSHEINVKISLSEKNSQMQVHTYDVGLRDLYFMKKMEMKPKIHSIFILLD
jgi:hypothetical protein